MAKPFVGIVHRVVADDVLGIGPMFKVVEKLAIGAAAVCEPLSEGNRGCAKLLAIVKSS